MNIFKQEYAGTKNEVNVLDESGAGNGCHVYEAVVKSPDDVFEFTVNFQHGSVKEVGINGIQNEHLIAMVIHRLQGFQSGPFSCRENELALTKLQEAMHWLEARTKDRSARNVEGKNQA